MSFFENFKGLNNVNPPEKTSEDELQVADNIDIDDSGQIRRRGGNSRVYSGVTHSLFADERICLFRESTALKRLNADYSASTLRSSIVGGLPITYLPLNKVVYYTDGIITGVVGDNRSRTWGIGIPGALSISSTVGDLQPGRYQVALTYLRNDGQESGASLTMVLNVSSGGIAINNIPTSVDPDVDYVCVYISKQDGEVMYRAMVLDNGTESANYRGVTTGFVVPLGTAYLSPPPAGQLLEFHKGRIWIAQDNILWYTESYQYELCNLAHNFIPFNSRISLLGRVGNGGLWVATQEEIIFIKGSDPQGFVTEVKAGYGAIGGSQRKIEGKLVGSGMQGMALMWATPRGVCVGTSEGAFENLTEKRYYYPSSDTGSGLIIEKEGMSQYVLSLKNASQEAYNDY